MGGGGLTPGLVRVEFTQGIQAVEILLCTFRLRGAQQSATTEAGVLFEFPVNAVVIRVLLEIFIAVSEAYPQGTVLPWVGFTDIRFLKPYRDRLNRPLDSPFAHFMLLRNRFTSIKNLVS